MNSIIRKLRPSKSVLLLYINATWFSTTKCLCRDKNPRFSRPPPSQLDPVSRKFYQIKEPIGELKERKFSNLNLKVREGVMLVLLDQVEKNITQKKTKPRVVDKIAIMLNALVKAGNSVSAIKTIKRHYDNESHLSGSDLARQFVGILKRQEQASSSSLEFTDYLSYQEYCNKGAMYPSIQSIESGYDNMQKSAGSLIRGNYSPKIQAVEQKTITEQMFYDDTGKLLSTAFANYVSENSVLKISSKHPKITTREEMELTNPAKWYPEARKLRRKVYLHIGPTNSGKTYNALQAFQAAQSGFYAGPLRLLAREVYNRMKNIQIPCNLITGEEIIEELDENGSPAQLSSGTVEMFDLNREIDVAVIDEIQMIDDRDRGYAWTNAFLGARAKEVHLCGDASSEFVIQNLCKLTGDELIVKQYRRLSPLWTDDDIIKGKYSNLQPGDCVVAFKKSDLFQLKIEIEHRYDFKCALIYGSLPAETRSEQAKLFNDPTSEYKVLLASDAVGMGLNLAIKRIIFTTVRKYDGLTEGYIPIALVKQIAGRAGRYQIAPTAGGTEGNANTTNNDPSGIVTCRSINDLKYVKDCLASVTPKIARAGLFPTDGLIEQYALKIGMNVPLHLMLRSLRPASRLNSLYFLTNLEPMVKVAEAFERQNDHLSFDEKLILSKAPVNVKIAEVKTAFENFCQVIADGEPVTIGDIEDTMIDYLRMTTLPPTKAADTWKLFTE